MEDNLVLIENNCGLKPINQELVEIGSDPNFVFLNDPEFSTMRLFDIDGNIINVNSCLTLQPIPSNISCTIII